MENKVAPLMMILTREFGGRQKIMRLHTIRTNAAPKIVEPKNPLCRSMTNADVNVGYDSL